MKKVLKLTTVVTLMLVTAVSMAATPNLKVVSNAPKSVSLTLDNAEHETLVRLFDTAGNAIFSQEISDQEKFAKRFDLSKLEKGTFIFKVENNLKEVIYSVELGDSKITILGKKENTKPVFRNKEGRVFVNLLNLEVEDVHIKVLDTADRIVFDEVLTNTTMVEKVFNFENAYAGVYTIIVKNKNNSYYETVVVE